MQNSKERRERTDTKVTALICGRGKSTQSWGQAQGRAQERGGCPEQNQRKMVAHHREKMAHSAGATTTWGGGAISGLPREKGAGEKGAIWWKDGWGENRALQGWRWVGDTTRLRESWRPRVCKAGGGIGRTPGGFILGRGGGGEQLLEALFFLGGGLGEDVFEASVLRGGGCLEGQNAG